MRAMRKIRHCTLCFFYIFFADNFLLIIHNVNPLAQKLSFRLVALYRLRRRNNRKPFLNILPFCTRSNTARQYVLKWLPPRCPLPTAPPQQSEAISEHTALRCCFLCSKREDTALRLLYLRLTRTEDRFSPRPPHRFPATRAPSRLYTLCRARL